MTTILAAENLWVILFITCILAVLRSFQYVNDLVFLIFNLHQSERRSGELHLSMAQAWFLAELMLQVSCYCSSSTNPDRFWGSRLWAHAVSSSVVKPSTKSVFLPSLQFSLQNFPYSACYFCEMGGLCWVALAAQSSLWLV